MHPEEVLCFFHYFPVSAPFTAYKRNTLNVSIGGIVPHVGYELILQITENTEEQNTREFGWDVAEKPTDSSRTVEKTIPLPPLKPGKYLFSLSLYDKFPGLKEKDEALLAFKSFFVTVKGPPRPPSSSFPLSSSSSSLPHCYAAPGSRRSVPLAGQWVRDPSEPAYWNLSCPLEWSKYSCVHMGNVTKGHDARRRFEPKGCVLSEIDPEELVAALGGRNLYFLGDSLLRQVFVALGCMLQDVIQEFDVPWEAHWPCHGRPNCYESGPHSGFHGAKLKLASGSTIAFVSDSIPADPNAIVVLEQGIHVPNLKDVDNNEDEQIGQAAVRLANTAIRLYQAGFDVYWLATPPSAFATRLGEFEPDVLQQEHDRLGDLPECRLHVPEPGSRRVAERAALRAAGVFERIEGAVEVEGMEGLGDCKVGRSVGVHGDCQHYCMPGVPDELARILYNQIVA